MILHICQDFFHLSELRRSGCDPANNCFKVGCLVLLVLEPSVLHFNDRYSSTWQSSKWFHILIVLPTYANIFLHSLQWIFFLFFFSGSLIYPSVAGKPNNCHTCTMLVEPSRGKNSEAISAIFDMWFQWEWPSMHKTTCNDSDSRCTPDTVCPRLLK